jgi:hypothetical protein
MCYQKAINSLEFNYLFAHVKVRMSCHSHGCKCFSPYIALSLKVLILVLDSGIFWMYPYSPKSANNKINLPMSVV